MALKADEMLALNHNRSEQVEEDDELAARERSLSDFYKHKLSLEFS